MGLFDNVSSGALQGVQNPYGVVAGALTGANPTHVVGSGPTPAGMNSFNSSNTDFSSYFLANQNGRSPERVFEEWQNLQRSSTPNDGHVGIYGNGLGWGEQPSGTTGYIGSGQSGLGAGSGGGFQPGSAPSSEPSNSTGQGLLNSNVTGASNTATPGGLMGFPSVGVSPPIQFGGGPVGGQVSGQGIPPGASGQGTVPMTQTGAGDALQNYYNTPGYQLTNGAGAVNQFQTSPGYQFAVNEALKQVQQQGASRGLLDSGAGLRAMTDRAQGMANQEFNNWQQNQQNQYNQYQNRLQGLASGPTGSDYAYQLGQGVGNNAMATGSNTGSLLANQGNSLFGGLVGAGGAQAQNVTQAGNMQAQILGSNLQTQMMLAALAAGRR